ncbi:hypothetical protein LP7551_04918 [Roseibium album]|nr:hypothetical protein LP7551_04918 [Roseibium album]
MTVWTLLMRRLPVVATGLAMSMWWGQAASQENQGSEFLYSCVDLQERSPRSSIGVKLYQGHDGWFFRERDLENLFEISEESLKALQSVNQALAYHDIHLVLVPMIPRGIVGRDKIPNGGLLSDMLYDAEFSGTQFSAFIESFKEAGIDAIDINGILEQNPEFDRASYTFSGDVHWKPAGARLVARAVADKVVQIEPELGSLAEYETSATGEEVLIRFNLTKSLNELCEDRIPPESIETFATKRKLDSLDALFDSDDNSDGRELLHIVGTSFSDEALHFNFAGFVREFLQREVSNFAVSGGGLTESIYSWSQKKTGLEKRPRILLWEYSDLREIQKDLDFVKDVIVPSIFGACAGELEVASGDFAEGARFSFGLPQTGGLARDHYLHLSFSNAALTGFRITYQYADGSEERVVFSNPKRVSGLNKLYQNFPENRGETPVKLSLEVENELVTSGNVQLCRYPADAFSVQPISN